MTVGRPFQAVPFREEGQWKGVRLPIGAVCEGRVSLGGERGHPSYSLPIQFNRWERYRLRSRERLLNRQYFTAPQIFPKSLIDRSSAAIHADRMRRDSLDESTSSANGWHEPRDHGSPMWGAPMNAILTFSTALATELHRLRCEVACHRRAIELEVIALEQSRSLLVSPESDLSRRLKALRQRLALLV